MYLSLFCMAKLINESQKAEKKQKFCIRFLGVFFFFNCLFYAFGRERNLNITLPSNRQMTVIIHRASEVEVA